MFFFFALKKLSDNFQCSFHIPSYCNPRVFVFLMFYCLYSVMTGRKRSSWCEWNSGIPRMSWTERCQGKNIDFNFNIQHIRCYYLFMWYNGLTFFFSFAQGGRGYSGEKVNVLISFFFFFKVFIMKYTWLSNQLLPCCRVNLEKLDLMESMEKMYVPFKLHFFIQFFHSNNFYQIFKYFIFR